MGDTLEQYPGTIGCHNVTNFLTSEYGESPLSRGQFLHKIMMHVISFICVYMCLEGKGFKIRLMSKRKKTIRQLSVGKELLAVHFVHFEL